MPQTNHRTLHVNEANLLPPEESCPFCRTRERKSVGIVQDVPFINLLECQRCGAFSVSRMPKAEYLRTEYYSRYYDNCASEKVTFDFPQRLADHIVRYVCAQINIKKRPSFSILDFGGGDGAIATAAAETLIANGVERVEAWIVDYNATERPSPNSRIKIRVAESISEVKLLSFDLVIASAIIEHLPDARETLLALFDAVGPGGGFYARTPSIVPFRTFVNRIRRTGPRIDIAFPGHLHDLGPKFWDYCLRDLGENRFKIINGSPAIPQTSFRKRFFRALLSFAFKAPWHIFGNRYTWIGAWEVFAVKLAQQAADA
jgi:2-polyprenyl-3-methyl-5-hydroxy-6-metoxy-1,4-benzoquinol methylase